jgi:hypothetical protein
MEKHGVEIRKTEKRRGKESAYSNGRPTASDRKTPTL